MSTPSKADKTRPTPAPVHSRRNSFSQSAKSESPRKVAGKTEDKQPVKSFPAKGSIGSAALPGDDAGNIYSVYRREIRTPGVYGGRGEGDRIAKLMNLKVRVFEVMDGELHHLITYGDGGTGGATTWALLREGYHYKAIEIPIRIGEAEAEARPKEGSQTRTVETAKSGDCLFEAMLIVHNQGGRVNNVASKIQYLRKDVSEHMSDEGIQHNLDEMIDSRNAVGAGKGVRAYVRTEIKKADIIATDDIKLDKRLDKLKSLTGLAGYGLDTLRDSFLELRKRFIDSGNDAIPRELIEALTRLTEMYKAASTALEEQTEHSSAHTVAAATSEDLQHLLTEQHWKQKLLSTTSGKDTTIDTDYWKKYGAKGSSGRPLATILQDIGPQLLRELDKSKTTGKLKLYRGMKTTEADAIMAWFNGKKDATETLVREKPEASAFNKNENVGIIPITGHLGDFDQASQYGKKDDESVLEFTLKPGAHELLFTTGYLAVGRSGRGATRYITASEPNSTYLDGSGNEGYLDGYIGMKSEDKGDFSLGGTSKSSLLLLQLLIETIRIVEKKS